MRYLHLVAGFLEVRVPGGKANFNAIHFANQSVADDVHSLVEIRGRALPRTGLPNAVVLLHSLHNRLLLGDCARERLLTVNVFVAPARFGGH